jgi:hypothetical protein
MNYFKVYLELVLSKSLLCATKTTKVLARPGQTFEIPSEILSLIKKKRKVRRILSRYICPTLRKLFNSLNRKIKVQLKRFKPERLASKFHELDSFNQSSSKHWKILNKLEKGPNQHTNAQTFISNGLKICDDQEIAENFASNL